MQSLLQHEEDYPFKFRPAESRMASPCLEILSDLIKHNLALMSQMYFFGSKNIMIVLLVIMILQTTHALTDNISHNKIRHWNNNNMNHLNKPSHSHKPSSKDDSSSPTTMESLNNLEYDNGARCLINASIPDEPKLFYYYDTELPIGILVSDRLTHKLASNVLKVFIEEILGYVNVTLVSMADPSQGFDPDTQFSYVSSCTDPKYGLIMI